MKTNFVKPPVDTVSLLIAILTRSVKQNRRKLKELQTGPTNDEKAFRARQLVNSNEMLVGIIKARMDAENRTIDGMLRKADR